MMRRALLIVATCALMTGCPTGGTTSGPLSPLSGIWSVVQANIPSSLPFTLGSFDPNAVFQLLNQGNGAISLTGLSEAIPSAITDQLANVLGGLGQNAGLLQSLLGLGDLNSLIDLFLGGGSNSLIQSLLNMLGLGSLTDMLNSLLDLQGLLGSSGLDLQSLIDQVLGAATTLPATIPCTLSGTSLTCDAVSQEVDLHPALDAVITLSVDVAGTFSNSSSVSLDVTVDATCDGTDCDAILSQLGVSFPFTYTVSASAP